MTPIEDLEPGDRVAVPAENGSAQTTELIARTYRVIQGEYYVLNGSTRVTGTHPFQTPAGWVIAERLEVADVLIRADGRMEPIVSIEKRTAAVRAYNIEVGGTHMFIADGYLVHNKGPDPND